MSRDSVNVAKRTMPIGSDFLRPEQLLEILNADTPPHCRQWRQEDKFTSPRTLPHFNLRRNLRHHYYHTLFYFLTLQERRRKDVLCPKYVLFYKNNFLQRPRFLGKIQKWKILAWKWFDDVNL